MAVAPWRIKHASYKEMEDDDPTAWIKEIVVLAIVPGVT